jgi:hypothetical protein
MVLSVRYNDLTNAASDSTRLANEIDTFCRNLQNNVRNRISSIRGGFGGSLPSADADVQRKITQLRNRENNARTLATRITTLRDVAKRVDGEVESLINDNRTRFFNANPHLRPPARKGFFASAIGFLRRLPVIGWAVRAVEVVARAIEVLAKEVFQFFKKHTKSILIAITAVVAAIVLVALIIVTAGAILAVFLKGLFIALKFAGALLAKKSVLLFTFAVGAGVGFTTQTISDIMTGKGFNPINSLIAALCTGVGFVVGAKLSLVMGTKGWKIGTTLGSGSKTILQGVARGDSFGTIAKDTAISIGVSLLIGKVTGWIPKGGYNANLTALFGGTAQRLTEETFNEIIGSVILESLAFNSLKEFLTAEIKDGTKNAIKNIMKSLNSNNNATDTTPIPTPTITSVAIADIKANAGLTSLNLSPLAQNASLNLKFNANFTFAPISLPQIQPIVLPNFTQFKPTFSPVAIPA